jgi:Flp pilus assembly protein TadD
VDSLDGQASLVSEAYDEYCQRKAQGEEVDIDAFCAEYPEIRLALQQQIEVHDLLLQHTSLIRDCMEASWPKSGDALRSLTLVEELGRGRFSRVFLARDSMLGDRQVVVKVHRGSSREAEILGKLAHKNIVPVYFADFAVEEGVSLLGMPFLGRATLHQVLRQVWKSGRRPRRAGEILEAIRLERKVTDEVEPSESVTAAFQRGSYVDGVLVIALQLAEAVAHAHRSGVLHLDLKPSNVLMTDDGCPRILDFNLAFNRQNHQMRLGGTPPYMSPEQTLCFLRGKDAAEVDERSDVYALGVMLHEMLCGTLPFRVEHQGPLSSTVLRDQFAQQQEASIDTRWHEYGVNRRLAMIVRRCLAPDPADRYASAGALAAALRHELRLVRRTRRWVILHRPIALAGVVLLLGMMLVASWFVASRDPYVVREYRKAIACEETGDFAQSVVHLTNCLAVDPEQPNVLFRRAKAYVQMGEFHRAYNDMVLEVQIAERGDTVAYLAFCCNCLGLDPEAAALYCRALELGNVSAAVFNNLGYTHFTQSRLEPAVAVLDRCLEMRPDCQAAQWNRALCHFAMAVKGRVAPVEAIRDLETALDHPTVPIGLVHVASRLYAYAARKDASYADRAAYYGQLAERLRRTSGRSSTGPVARQVAYDDRFDGESPDRVQFIVDMSRLLDPLAAEH